MKTSKYLNVYSVAVRFVALLMTVMIAALALPFFSITARADGEPSIECASGVTLEAVAGIACSYGIFAVKSNGNEQPITSWTVAGSTNTWLSVEAAAGSNSAAEIKIAANATPGRYVFNIRAVNDMEGVNLQKAFVIIVTGSAPAGGTTENKTQADTPAQTDLLPAQGEVPSTPEITEAQRAYAEYHDHAHNGNFENFTWSVVSEATEYSDGLEVYKCPDCGYVHYTVPISAFLKFNRTDAEKLNKAPRNGMVTIDAGQWISFHRMVIDAWKTRPDVTLAINYTYKHEPYRLTIPAGTDLSSVIRDDEQFVGFLAISTRTDIPATAR